MEEPAGVPQVDVDLQRSKGRRKVEHSLHKPAPGWEKSPGGGASGGPGAAAAGAAFCGLARGPGAEGAAGAGVTPAGGAGAEDFFAKPFRPG